MLKLTHKINLKQIIGAIMHYAIIAVAVERQVMP